MFGVSAGTPGSASPYHALGATPVRSGPTPILGIRLRPTMPFAVESLTTASFRPLLTNYRLQFSGDSEWPGRAVRHICPRCQKRVLCWQLILA